MDNVVLLLAFTAKIGYSHAWHIVSGVGGSQTVQTCITYLPDQLEAPLGSGASRCLPFPPLFFVKHAC